MATLNKFGHVRSQSSNNIQGVYTNLRFLQHNIKRLEEKILQVEASTNSRIPVINEQLTNLEKKLKLCKSEIEYLLKLKGYGTNKEEDVK